MINVTNFTCKDNPTWPAGPKRGPARPAAPDGSAASGGGSARSRGASARSPGGTGARSPGGRIGHLLGIAAGVVLSWLAFITRRLGDHIFTMNDTEANWRGWEITKVRGGLGRRYRDPLFDTLAACPDCRGGGVNSKDGRAGAPCERCLGTGRITIDGVS